MARLHRLYLSPGMFGFGKLATYDYFAHVERALVKRFRAAGEDLVCHTCEVAPTASIRRRATRLAELIAHTCESDDSPIHLLGHSTGGLDARLVASPSVHLPTTDTNLAWLPRLKSLTTMSTPHYGTPLASFFATVSGQRMLYAVSALTFIGLSLGAPPIAAASTLVVAIGRIDRALGIELRVLDRTTDALLKALEPASSKEVRFYLDAIRRDQGAVIQLTPEAMDLFQAGVEDRPGVFYQSTVSMAPPPGAQAIVRSFATASPWRLISSTLFTTLYQITSRFDEGYPCAAPERPVEIDAALRRAIGRPPDERSNDGVVPTLSQVWGHVAWAGYADHLDVLGHFPGKDGDKPFWSRWLRGKATVEEAVEDAAQKGGLPPDPKADTRNVDWLRSGANFDERSFDTLMDAVSEGMLNSFSDPSP